jgi:hypothetical protein
VQMDVSIWEVRYYRSYVIISQIFQLQDEQFTTWFRTHVSPITNSLSLAM